MSDPVVLPPRLDLSAAADLKTTLLKTSGQDTVLDFSKVKFLGALCLQVMIASARAALANDCNFRLINVSDRVADQMRMVGVSADSLAEGMR